MVSWIICNECKTHQRVYAKGLCGKCYRKSRINYRKNKNAEKYAKAKKENRCIKCLKKVKPKLIVPTKCKECMEKIRQYNLNYHEKNKK